MGQRHYLQYILSYLCVTTDGSGTLLVFYHTCVSHQMGQRLYLYSLIPVFHARWIRDATCNVFCHTCVLQQMGQRHYLQCTGISQGSVVSTLLASIYLSHLEATHLSVLSDELLIRMMDDYLFLTPDRTRAQHFLEVMMEGNDNGAICTAKNFGAKHGMMCLHLVVPRRK